MHDRHAVLASLLPGSVAPADDLPTLEQQVVAAHGDWARRVVPAPAGLDATRQSLLDTAVDVGLVAAVRSYEPRHGRFDRWASLHVKRHVLRQLRDWDPPTDLDRCAAVRDVAGSLGPGATDEQVAAAADVDIASVARIRKAGPAG